jgi:hypothetical protein
MVGEARYVADSLAPLVVTARPGVLGGGEFGSGGSGGALGGSKNGFTTLIMGGGGDSPKERLEPFAT